MNRSILAGTRGRLFRSGALALAMISGAGAGHAQSLPDTMVSAYLNSPEIDAARADIKVRAERAVQARAGGRLNVEARAGIEAELFENDQRSSVGTPLPFDRYDTRFPNSVSLSLVQPLYTGGRVENATESAETRITVSEATLVSTEQEVLLNAVTAFVDVRRDIEFVSLGENNVRVLSEQLRAANERFEVGEVTRTDVEQARARLAAARSRLAAATGALAASRQSYLRAVGEAPGDLLPPPPLPDLPASQDEAVAMALRDDPSVIAARLEREATGHDVRAAIGTLLPQVTLEGNLSSTESGNDNSRRKENIAVGLFVTMPLYAGGGNYSNVREAQASAEGASAQITSAMRLAVRNVGVSWANLEVARASIRAGKLEVAAAQLAFEGVREEAKVGARTTLDVLDAEQEVLNARANLVSARRDEYVAAYSLLASIGKLTVAHLGLDTGLTSGQPSYYETVRDRNFGYDASDDTVWSTRWRP
ncbi:MAG TPA: TolC family outer membrane protein [Thermohalobaculum sp.]|nr:TolC family outer membrane protein [Thermohalobaculum sp.]